jgi:uncharacterized protein (DUF362 family)
LRLAALGGIGAGVALLEYITQPVGAWTYLRWMARREFRHRLGSPVVVALGECPTYDADVSGCLRDLWQMADMPDVQGKRVLVKPNLVDYIPDHWATTSPVVVGALVDELTNLGASQIAVGDGPAFRREAQIVAERCGLLSVLAARNVPFVDLNYDDPRPVAVKDGWLRRSPTLWLPRHVLEADLIISVPKVKTHHWAAVSLSIKNLFGVVPGCRYGWPKNILHVNGLFPSILGIYQTLPPVVAVTDGIIGMEGDGPLFGTPVPHGFLAIGRDPVAVDVVCAQLMGFSIDDVAYLSLADWTGIGQTRRIETRGAPVERLQRYYQRVKFD